VPAVERALYDDGDLVRLLCMRRTMFAVSAGSAPIVYAAAGATIAARERTQVLRFLAERDPAWDARWLARVETATLAALAARGTATAAELAEDVAELRARFVVSPDKPYAGNVTVGNRVVRLLAAECRIRRERPRGGWTSSQFRWSVAPPLAPLPDATSARADLARAWLASYGPATVADLKWWTGWTVTQARAALAAIDAHPVVLADGPGFVAAGDTEPVPAVEPTAVLLPALDPTAMGWRHRDWYLAPEFAAQLFDNTGNVGPTVWWDGRVVGGWAQRPDGRIVWELLADPGRAARAAIAARAEELGGWLADTRVTPRFRTPLERRLSA
jgi:hypothetical protein